LSVSILPHQPSTRAFNFFLPNPCQKSADPLSDQPGDFSIIGESLTLNVLFRVDQLAVTFNIKDTATAFDQFDI
jgi:hypothetical protein